MKCNYCDHALREESGLLNSSANSPEIHFWVCDTCGHTHMDQSQEDELSKAIKENQ